MSVWKYCGCGAGMDIPKLDQVLVGVRACEQCDFKHAVEDHEKEACAHELLTRLERLEEALAQEVCLATQSAPLAQQAGQPPQEFESAHGRNLAAAWSEGWAQCRDAEFIGEDAEGEAFNQSNTLAECLHADQLRFQGGLSNDQLRRAWGAKLPRVIPTDEQLTAFALGIEVATTPPQEAAQVEPQAMPPAKWLAEAERMANRIGGLAYHAHLRTQLSQALDELRAHLSKRVTGVIPADGEVRNG